MPTAIVQASSAGDNAIVAAVAGKKIRVQEYLLNNNVVTAQNAKWRSGATDLTGVLAAPAAIGTFAQDGADDTVAGDEFLFETVAGQALNLNLSAATAVGGYVRYTLE